MSKRGGIVRQAQVTGEERSLEVKERHAEEKKLKKSEREKSLNFGTPQTQREPIPRW